MAFGLLEVLPVQKGKWGHAQALKFLALMQRKCSERRGDQEITWTNEKWPRPASHQSHRPRKALEALLGRKSKAAWTVQKVTVSVKVQKDGRARLTRDGMARPSPGHTATGGPPLK